ncbi:LAME_0A06326g1_1 [Lachancea meyersii CBS 8951]|uniref:LAME_0A06326g1_1 n=1 Tax=Lachancea meyersii CBS 8951 TaxID=1266667 RepID=A0A1G4IQA6_9SACH|nr:LAME_0A06326g1_1 [Lachancea meyersii CBS 8951]
MILPPEIVYEVLTFQFYDLMSNNHPSSPEKFYSNLRIFLRSNLTVNKTFYHICRVLLYRYLNFTSARGFNKLLESLRSSPEVLRYIEVADFQELTSIGLGRSGQMNKSIKNLTNETLWEFLSYTQRSLREFLASEHIQADLDERIIHFLLEPGTVLSVVDFCGCSHDSFTTRFSAAVEQLYSNDQPIAYNYQITALGLNDCTTITPKTLGRLLMTLPELQKLDLARTAIDDRTLISDIPHLKNLTHLSLAMCSQLTPRGVLEFFSYHPAVTDKDNISTLQWLNVQVHPHSSSWTDVQLMFLLKKLCHYGHNKTMQYLNIGGLPMHITDDTTAVKTTSYWQCQDTLHFIKINFPRLKSLSIKDNNITIPKLTHFLSPLQNEEVAPQHLKFLNIANNAYLNRWTIQDPAIFSHSKTLCALEMSFDPWQQIEASNAKHEITCRLSNSKSLIQDYSLSQLVKWRCYIGSAYGRRYWIYKTDKYLNREDLETRGFMTTYDTQGNKIIDIVKQPDFLKFAQTKIMLGCGIVGQSRFRRNQTYRDHKPPVSRFLNRDKALALSPAISPPQESPAFLPGGWRVIENQHNTDQESEDIAASEDEDEVGPASRNGLYWDRSLQNLQVVEPVETDSDYLNSPELQRRRSALCLFNGYSGSNQSPANRLKTETDIAKLLNSSNAQMADFYSTNSDLDDYSKIYRTHLVVATEYNVFGCVERGMYRYYSLKS